MINKQLASCGCEIFRYKHPHHPHWNQWSGSILCCSVNCVKSAWEREREVGVRPEKLICVLLTYEVNLWGKGGNCVFVLVYNSCLWCVDIPPLKNSVQRRNREANEMQMRAALNSVSGNKVIVSEAVELTLHTSLSSHQVRSGVPYFTVSTLLKCQCSPHDWNVLKTKPIMWS